MQVGTVNSDTCSGVQAEGRDKEVYVGNMQWVCDWNASEISGTIQSPPGNISKLQDFWRWRKFPPPKLSPSKLSLATPRHPCRGIGLLVSLLGNGFGRGTQRLWLYSTFEVLWSFETVCLAA